MSTTTLTSGLVGRSVFCVFLLPAPSRIICASPSVGSMGHNGAKMQPSGATSSPHTLNWWSSGNDFKLGWNITKTTMPAIQNDSNLTQTHDDQCPPPVLNGRSTFELGDHRTQTRFLERMSTFDMEDHDLDIEHHQCHNAPVEVSYGFLGSLWRRHFGELAMGGWPYVSVARPTTHTPKGTKY